MKTIVLSGGIGYDVTPTDVRRQIALADGTEPLMIEIASPGGFVTDGLEIFNVLRAYPGRKTTRILGLAASMASYVAMAGDEIVAEANAVFMIHNVLGGVLGDHNDLRKTADIFEGFSSLLAAEYSRKSGMSLADIRALMDAESWYFGEQILEAGFCDRIEGTPSSAAPRLEAQARAQVSACLALVRGSNADRDRPEQLAAAMAQARATGSQERARFVPPNGLSVFDYAKLKAAGLTDDEISFFSKEKNL